MAAIGDSIVTADPDLLAIATAERIEVALSAGAERRRPRRPAGPPAIAGAARCIHSMRNP
ncbi:MAG: hypothetical protein BroJett022_24830 [Actinomycetes bacterium]|nr:MAG: hypothetical protein BroJett022_24830 [Actinomycetes bacterium]